MLKEEKIIKEETKFHKFCDICGIEVKIGMACCKAYCVICGRDLCDKCVEHEEYDGSDYRTCYCKDCWSSGDKYREKIVELEDTVAYLYDEWHKECEKFKIKK